MQNNTTLCIMGQEVRSQMNHDRMSHIRMKTAA